MIKLLNIVDDSYILSLLPTNIQDPSNLYQWIVENNYDIISFYHPTLEKEMVLIFLNSFNPISGLHEGHVIGAEFCPALDKNLWTELIEFVEKTASIRGYQWIFFETHGDEVALHEALEDRGWGFNTQFLKKQLCSIQPTINSTSSPFTIRPLEQKDRSFVFDCLLEATYTGIPDKMKPLVRQRELLQPVVELYSPILEEGLCYVIENEGALCGHGTVELGNTDLFTGVSYASLVDIFILPEYNNKGLSRMMNAFLEDACLHKGYDQLHGSVEVGPNSNVILNHLLSNGWIESTRIYGYEVRTHG